MNTKGSSKKVRTMGRAIIKTFETEREAVDYVETQTEFNKKDLVIYHEPELLEAEPYTVNLD